MNSDTAHPSDSGLTPVAPFAFNDRHVLAGAAYRDGSRLAARQNLFTWANPRHDLPAIIAAALRDHFGGRQKFTLVDVGAGNGTYTRHLRNAFPDARIAALDISPGILAGLEPPTLVADAAALPFADSSIDAVLALHMLYHLRDPDTGLSELARVLAPDGVAYISTNHSRDKEQLDQLWSRAAADVLGVTSGPQRISLSSHFSLDTAADRMEAHFETVLTTDINSRIEIHHADPVIAHLASYQAWANQAGVPFQPTLDRARQIITQHIGSHGEFTITVHSAICTATGPARRE